MLGPDAVVVASEATSAGGRESEDPPRLQATTMPAKKRANACPNHNALRFLRYRRRHQVILEDCSISASVLMGALLPILAQILQGFVHRHTIEPRFETRLAGETINLEKNL